MNQLLFPFAEYWWLYGAFVGFVLLLLLLDLGIFHRKTHEVSIKESLMWTVVWLLLALAFNIGLYYYGLQVFPHSERLMAIPGFDPQAAAKQTALEFLTGFLIEKALAADNIFVFVLVFSYFGVATIYQHRILFYGILGALVFRACFISLGAILLQYHWVLVGFGIFLLFTGVKMLFTSDETPDLDKNPVINLARRILPVTSRREGQRFFLKEDGRWRGTPLFMALIFVEASDIIFAIDSVPAIFAITKEPFIVFTSNIFAILGLRSLYFVLAGLVERFHYMKHGLGFILIFVGLKMAWLDSAFDGKFPIVWSLGIIVGILVLSVGLSLLIPPKRGQKGP